jgi:hypothetical protein
MGGTLGAGGLYGYGFEVSIEAQDCMRNLDMARRRLQRWYRERKNPVLSLTAPFEAIAKRALDRRIDEPTDEGIVARVREDILDYRDYYRRKSEAPVLFLKTMPADLRWLIEEANEAFAWGLCRAAVILGRAMLEDVAKRVVRDQAHRTARPRTERDFHAVLNCVPPDILFEREKDRARELYVRCSQIAHESSVDVYENVARTILTEVAGLIETMVRRDGLRGRRPPPPRVDASAASRTTRGSWTCDIQTQPTVNRCCP